MGEFTIKGVGEELAAVLPKDPTPWYKQGHLLRLNFTILCLVLFGSAMGYDGSMMNGLQALPQWQAFMNSPTGAWLGFINAVQSLGALLFVPVIAWSNNRFGRKKTLAWGYFWLVIGVAIQGGATNPAMFTIGRLCIGGVSAAFGATSPLLITEIAYPTHRSITTSLYNTGWYIGSTIAAWATYGTRDYTNSWAWRIPSILQLLIPLAILPGYILAPESPRWLIANERVEEARDFLVRYHAGGDETSPLVAFELEEISYAVRLERDLKKSTGYLDMLRTKGNRRRTFITVTLGIYTQWNGVGVVSYYLAPVLKTVGINSVAKQTLISGFLQIWNEIISLSAALCVDAAGRRRLFFISTIGMLACYIIISGLAGSFANSGASAVGISVIPFLFLYYGFYDIGFTPLIMSYTCEIWPYTLRARGLAVVNITTQLAVFFNIFVNPIALESIKWKYYLVYVVILVVILATIYFFYPETNNHSLEEMARIFDGADAAVREDGAVLDIIAAKNDGDVREAEVSHHDRV